VEVKNADGNTIETCADQAAAGLCGADFMNDRTCRKSCGKCGTVKTPSTGGIAEVSAIDTALNWEDTYHVYDQGTDCTLNKGMPTFELYEKDKNAPQSEVVAGDDLVIPAGKTIYIDQIHLAARWTPLPDDDIPEDEQLVEVRATIFHNGTVRCRMTVMVYPRPLLRLNVSSYRCFLSGAHEEPSGWVNSDETYWLTVSSFSNSVDKPLLYWGFSYSKNGDEFQWKDPANYFQQGLCPKYTNGTKCGLDTYGTDMCFRFLGYEMDTVATDRYFAATLPLSGDEDGTFATDDRSPTVFTPEGEQSQEDQKGDIGDNLNDNKNTYGGPKDIQEGDINDLEILAYVIPLVAFFTVLGILLILSAVAAWQRPFITQLWNADDYTAFSDFE